MPVKNLNWILDFAIARELEANVFYLGLAERVEQPAMKKVFADFAAEEERHKQKIEAVKAGGTMLSAEQEVIDLKIADYLVEPAPPEADISYKDALILAMKREKEAFRLYKDLSEAAKDDVTRDLFAGLANEEAKHKLYFETEYDENFLSEN